MFWEASFIQMERFWLLPEWTDRYVSLAYLKFAHFFLYIFKDVRYLNFFYFYYALVQVSIIYIYFEIILDVKGNIYIYFHSNVSTYNYINLIIVLKKTYVVGYVCIIILIITVWDTFFFKYCILKKFCELFCFFLVFLFLS